MAKPSYTGTAWVTPSPESSTTPVVRPEEYLYCWKKKRVFLSTFHPFVSIFPIHPNPVVQKGKNVQTQHCLYGGEESRYVESLKEDLSGQFTVSHWVEWRLSQEDRMLSKSTGER